MKFNLSIQLLETVLETLEGDLKDFVSDAISFEKFADTASGCDWCPECGGGDTWSQELDQQLETLGWDSWDSLETHLETLLPEQAA